MFNLIPFVIIINSLKIQFLHLIYYNYLNFFIFFTVVFLDYCLFIDVIILFFINLYICFCKNCNLILTILVKSYCWGISVRFFIVVRGNFCIGLGRYLEDNFLLAMVIWEEYCLICLGLDFIYLVVLIKFYVQNSPNIKYYLTY
jgi:hypothetical protein